MSNFKSFLENLAKFSQQSSFFGPLKACEPKLWAFRHFYTQKWKNLQSCPSLPFRPKFHILIYDAHCEQLVRGSFLIKFQNYQSQFILLILEPLTPMPFKLFAIQQMGVVLCWRFVMDHKFHLPQESLNSKPLTYNALQLLNPY